MKVDFSGICDTLRDNKLIKPIVQNRTERLIEDSELIGIYIYFKLLNQFKEQLIHGRNPNTNNCMDKIPHIKFVRECTRKKLYKNGPDSSDYNDIEVMGLRQAKEFIELLYAEGFIIEQWKLDKQRLESHKGFPPGNLVTLSGLSRNESWVLNDIGEILLEELEQYVSEEEIMLLLTKSIILVPDVTRGRNNISEEFMRVFLDYIHYGGLHV